MKFRCVINLNSIRNIYSISSKTHKICTNKLLKYLKLTSVLGKNVGASKFE